MGQAFGSRSGQCEAAQGAEKVIDGLPNRRLSAQMERETGYWKDFRQLT